MTDAENLKGADAAVAILKEAYARDGADAAVQVAERMIDAAAALIAREQGPDQARRFLHNVGSLYPPKEEPQD